MYLPVLKNIAIVTHTIHVRYIHLHLVDFDGKCGYINIPYMDLMGNGDASRNYIHKWWIFPPLNVRPVAFDLVKNTKLFLEHGTQIRSPYLEDHTRTKRKWFMDHPSFISRGVRPFGKGTTTLLRGQNLTMVINHLLSGMILEVISFEARFLTKIHNFSLDFWPIPTSETSTDGQIMVTLVTVVDQNLRLEINILWVGIFQQNGK